MVTYDKNIMYRNLFDRAAVVKGIEDRIAKSDDIAKVQNLVRITDEIKKLAIPVNQTVVTGIYRPENKTVDQEEVNDLIKLINRGEIPESLQLEISASAIDSLALQNESHKATPRVTNQGARTAAVIGLIILIGMCSIQCVDLDPVKNAKNKVASKV